METAPLTNLKPEHNDIIRPHFPPELFGSKSNRLQNGPGVTSQGRLDEMKASIFQ